MSFPYNPLIPAAPNDPADDQPLMQQNFATIGNWVAVDHIGFNESLGGNHNIIHLVTQTSPNMNLGQLFSQDVTTSASVPQTDTQLFYTSPGGTTSQLTGQLIGTPSAGTNLNDGYCWIGGILLQWGIVTTTSSGSFASGSASGTVTFRNRITSAINFPNNIFEVIPNAIWTNSSGSPSGSASVNITRSNTGPTFTDRTQFSWQFNSNSNKYVGFSWIALGN